MTVTFVCFPTLDDSHLRFMAVRSFDAIYVFVEQLMLKDIRMVV